MAADAALTPKPRRWAWLRRALAGALHPRRKLTRAEQREIDAEKLDHARRKSAELGLQVEAEQIARNLILKLKDKGVRYEYRKKDGSGLARYKLVGFMRPYVIREEAIYLKVDLRPGHSPPGIGVPELSNPELLPDLEIATGHPVKHFYSAKAGFWYIVERESGRRGIPNHVNYYDVLAARPAEIDRLALPIGMRADKKFYWQTLRRLYSLLIAGTPGTGKSNVINAMLCALLKYNSPRMLNLILVDLKGGVEFTFYDGVPHLLPVPIGEGKQAAIIERREHVIPALEWLIAEGERRMEALKAKRVKTIGEWNQNQARMAHIVLVIDEWADVKVEPKIGNRAEELLINVSNRFRAAGIHVILCTQSPTREVISLRIKNAIPAKLAFSMSNVYASMLVIGNGGAQGLEPVGRAIFDWNQVQFELQTPYINNETVDEMVSQAIRGEWEDSPARKCDVSDLEVYEWALNERSGFLVGLDIYHKFQARGMAQQYAEDFCRNAQGKKVIVNGTAYEVLAAARANQGRRLMSTEQMEAEELAKSQPQEPEPERPIVTEQELIEWALAQNKGRLNRAAVYEEYRPRGLSKNATGAILAALEGQTFTVGGQQYRVLPAVIRRGNEPPLPRRLELLEPAASAGPPPGPEPEPEPATEPASQPASAESPDETACGPVPGPARELWPNARPDETGPSNIEMVASPA